MKTGGSGMDGFTLGAIAITLVFWASAFAAIRAGLKGLDPAHLTLLRFLVASAVFVVVAWLAKIPLPDRRDWPRLFLLGLLGITIYHTALNYGEVVVPAGTASLIIAAGPVFTALIARWLLQERLTMVGWLGVALAFAGVVVITVGAEHTVRFTTSALLILAAALSTSFFFVLEKPLFERYPAIHVTAYVTWAGTLPMLFYWPGFPAALQQAGIASNAAVVYAGIFPAAIAYMAWNTALSRAPAGQVASFLNLSPALAIFIGWLWLGELPSSLALAGGLVAIAGVVVVNRFGQQRKASGGASQEEPAG